MPEVYVGVGSNVERERRVREGVAELRRSFGVLRSSPVYESAAVGFDGSPFFNLVVGFRTALAPQRLVEELHAIEARCGRDRAARKFAPRPMDLDLLIYGKEIIRQGVVDVPREDILIYGFVLKPLADLAADRRHPVTNKTYAELWAEFRGEGRRLKVVDMGL